MVPGSFNWSSPHSTGPQVPVLAYSVPKWPILTKQTDTIFSLCITSIQSSGPRLIQLVPKLQYTAVMPLEYQNQQSGSRPKGTKDEEKRPKVPPANSGIGTLFHIFLSHRLLCENLFCLCCAILPLTFRCSYSCFNVSTDQLLHHC